MKLILPKTLVPDEQILQPLLFLAGPIKGGGNWQEIACEYLAQHEVELTVAAPRRWTAEHRMSTYRSAGTEDAFARQTLWERHYLERASSQGCIVFWLPCESVTDPRDDGQPYARDSYGELGAWRSRLGLDPSVRLVIGAEKDFPGLSVLQCNLDEDTGSSFPIYPTLTDTLDAAIRIATR